MTAKTFLDAALYYGDRLGWPIFPLAPGTKIPLKDSHGVKDATTDAATIREWWKQTPGANIGLACGELLAVDLDVKNGLNGIEVWAALQLDADTVTSRTPSGGRHLIYRANGAKLGNSAGKLGDGIDTRGAGGYIVLPPSTLGNGVAYEWEVRPTDKAPADLPAELVAMLSKPPQAIPVIRPTSTPTANAEPYARAALQKELDGLARTPKGGRNDRLNKAAFSLGQLVGAVALDRAEVEAQLLAVATAIGLGKREAAATIRSGLDAGEQKPRDIPPPTRPGQLAAEPAASTPPPRLEPVVPAGDHLDAPPLPEYARLPEDLGQGTIKWLDDYVSFSRTWSPRSFEGFHEACALWLLSTVAARRVVVHFGRPRYTNLYLLLAGRTTMHAKSSATDIVRELLRACGLDYLLAADEATPQAFVRALAGGGLPVNFEGMDEDHQAAAEMRLAFCGQRGWYAEEFGSWLASMTRADGIMADFRGLLRKFDDCPPDYTRSTIARGDEVIDRPYLALIANLTPADLRPVAKRGTQLWGDGFLARFAFVTPPREEVLTSQFPKGARPCPTELTQPLETWHKRLGLPIVEVEDHLNENGEPTGEKQVTIEPPQPQVLELAGDVWEALYQYNAAVLEVAQESELTDLDGNYGRLHEKALRVAALLASVEGSEKVELRHWARAQAIAERWRQYTHRLYDQVTQLETSKQSEIEDKILDAVRRWQGTEKYPDGLTPNDIGRFIRGLGAGEVKLYADQLVGADVLARHKAGRAMRYYLPGQAKGRQVDG